MQKRGQFFLVAALIIIVVIFSIATVYNSISSQKSDIDYTQNLANNVKQESFHVINNGFFNSLTSDQITQNLHNLTIIYSTSNPSYNISYVSFNAGDIQAYTFSNGAVTNVSTHASKSPSSNNITLSLNNIDHSFNLTKGYNLFVVVQKENEDEKYIAEA